MNAVTTTKPLIASSDARQNVRRRRCVRLAFVCFGIGFSLPVVGMAMLVLHAALEHDKAFGTVGTILMITSIPMLLLASHLMDLSERS